MRSILSILLLSLLGVGNTAFAQLPGDIVPSGTPDAVVDLATEDGARSVSGRWRYSDVKIVETDFTAAGTDGQPSRVPNKTYDFEPHGGDAGFDDSSWSEIGPQSLSQRRSTGRLCFNWYRITLTVPQRIGDFDPTNSTAVLETSLDDYAEIWVDGELSRLAGQSGGSVIAGWNATNRIIVGRNLKPGQKIQLAIFGINGPLSNPPTNYIWMRFARLLFYTTQPGPVAVTPQEINVRVQRNDSAIDEIIPLNPKIYKLAEGFQFTEGPIWVPGGKYLLFSDPNHNTIYKYSDESGLSVFLTPSGYEGSDLAEYGQPGSNGLTLDPQGRLTANQHGNRRVIRINADGSTLVIADSYQGKRLNSPNDLVYRSDGTLYFTDPPFGLPKFFEDTRKQLPYSGVFSAKDGKVQLLSTDLSGPNGIAFSPDEKYLYVTNWDDKHKVVMRYRAEADGKLSGGMTFFDMTSAPGEDALDGIKVDVKGNLYVSGPGGVWILSPEGKRLGTIITPHHPHNLAWGDDDYRTLYMTSQSELYRMRLNVPGIRPTTTPGSVPLSVRTTP